MLPMLLVYNPGYSNATNLMTGVDTVLFLCMALSQSYDLIVPSCQNGGEGGKKLVKYCRDATSEEEMSYHYGICLLFSTRSSIYSYSPTTPAVAPCSKFYPVLHQYINPKPWYLVTIRTSSTEPQGTLSSPCGPLPCGLGNEGDISCIQINM
ncbi:hypothetical protein CPB86DRAFT_782271 [Serendipita vermifera]|nr:hypothetical protein CPB86DRAFT_782271 [Serendipita vermifera]